MGERVEREVQRRLREQQKIRKLLKPHPTLAVDGHESISSFDNPTFILGQSPIKRDILIRASLPLQHRNFGPELSLPYQHGRHTKDNASLPAHWCESSIFACCHITQHILTCPPWPSSSFLPSSPSLTSPFLTLTLTLDSRTLPLTLPKFHQKYETRGIPVPTPGPNDLLIKTGAAGFCHTDYQVWEGVYKSPLPITGSHEPVGTIVALGKDVDGGSWKVGMRVGVLLFR